MHPTIQYELMQAQVADRHRDAGRLAAQPGHHELT